MGNQLSSIGFGSDANVLAGYALSANDRLGKIDLIIANIPPAPGQGRATDGYFPPGGTLYLRIKEHDGKTAPSGYVDILPAPIIVVPGGQTTVSLNLLSKQIGFFGSGNCSAQITPVIRNPADLRGSQIDIVAGPSRQAWSWPDATDVKAFRSPGWPAADTSQGSGIPG